jgi:hypothetical protein
MKMIEVSDEFYNAACLLAQYIDGSDLDYNSFLTFIRDKKNNPKDHIYYQAAIVGGWTNSIDLDHIQK